MKFTEEIIDVFNAASKINDHIVINAGTLITSISPKGNMYLRCRIPYKFPMDFALHDIKGFIRQLSLFDEPELTFYADKVLITDQTSSSEYYYSDREDLSYIEDEINITDFCVEFNLSNDAINKVIRASAANKTEDIVFGSEEGKLTIKTLDKEDPKRIFSVYLGDNKEDFFIAVKHNKESKLTLLPLDYTVNVSTGGQLRFDGLLNDVQVTYYLAAEQGFDLSQLTKDEMS